MGGLSGVSVMVEVTQEDWALAVELCQAFSGSDLDLRAINHKLSGNDDYAPVQIIARHRTAADERVKALEGERTDAVAHINGAISALAIEGWRIGPDGEETPIAPLEISLADELERVDSAIGPKGQSMFFAVAQLVREAMIELHAARRALGEG